MFVAPRIRLSLMIASCVVSCGPSSARFETSVVAPKSGPPEEPLPLYYADTRAPAYSDAEIQQTTDRFLLALENGTQEQLEAVLAPEATLRNESSGTGNPALPALLALCRTWTGPEVSPQAPGSGALIAPFGPAEVVELSSHADDTWATVVVEGPPQVEGHWNLRLRRSAGVHQIHEVIVPKGQ